MSYLVEVWIPASLLAATIGGLAAGWLLTRTVRSSMDRSRLASAVLTFYVFAVCGSAFWVGQVIATFLAGEVEATPRVTSRFALWLIFSAALAAGVYVTRRIEEPEDES